MARVCYAICDSNGVVRTYGYEDDSTLGMAPPIGLEGQTYSYVTMSSEIFNQVSQVYHPYYLRYDEATSTIVMKKVLNLQADKYTIAANYPDPPPSETDPVTWDFATVSWNAPESVLISVAGNVVSATGSVQIVSSVPLNILVQVDPFDPNYYTDDRATVWSAAGDGMSGGGIVINAEEPAKEEEVE